MYVLCDINAAYVAFIQTFNPQFDFNRTPLAVLSSNQGNVIARNQPLKAIGVKMGEPAFKVQKLIHENKGHIWGSNFELFGEMSQRFHHEVEYFFLDATRYSVDESIGVIHSDTSENLKTYGHLIKNTLKKNLGLMCGVGIGPTKTLSKLASHCSKEQKWLSHTKGVVVLDTTEKVEWALQRVKLTDIWGIGSKTGATLEKAGIHNGLQLIKLDVAQIKKQYGVVLARTVQELQGVNAIELNDLYKSRDRICVSQSMGIHVTELRLIKEALATHITSAATKLRGFNLFSGAITVFLHTDRFREEHAQYSNSIQIKLPSHSADTSVLLKYALFAIERIFKDGYKYKKTGVILEQLISNTDMQQTSLFEATQKLEVNKQTKISDEINKRFGQDTIKLGVSGFTHSWKPKCDLAPKSYTTKLSDIPTAYCK